MGNMVMFLTPPGIGLLAVAGVGCLIFCKDEAYYRHLARTAVVFLTAFALFFGGIILLGCFHLTWRNAPSAILCVVLLVSGWVGVVLTLACLLPREWKGVPVVLRRAAKGLVVLSAAVVLLSTLWIGPMGIIFVYGDSERVVEYQSQRLVERLEGFLSPDYSYYLYHGPLVRGSGRLYTSIESPLTD